MAGGGEEVETPLPLREGGVQHQSPGTREEEEEQLPGRACLNILHGLDTDILVCFVCL